MPWCRRLTEAPCSRHWPRRPDRRCPGCWPVRHPDPRDGCAGLRAVHVAGCGCCFRTRCCRPWTPAGCSLQRSGCCHPKMDRPLPQAGLQFSSADPACPGRACWQRDRCVDCAACAPVDRVPHWNCVRRGAGSVAGGCLSDSGCRCAPGLVDCPISFLGFPAWIPWRRCRCRKGRTNASRSSAAHWTPRQPAGALAWAWAPGSVRTEPAG